ncbi:MAG: glucose-6-phosphate dehydrogenase [Verrucomicrobiae bacterium]|nr:glucose-6-phosphate dehydrogenase [Verrucomicrobiae bacterium]
MMQSANEDAYSCQLDSGRKVDTPCTVVIFGASGDLTARKLIPALYHLYAEGRLPEPFQVIGVARRPKNHETWREELRAALERFSRTGAPSAERWQAFAGRVFYCEGDFNQAQTYARLKEMLAKSPVEALRRNLLFYLAVAPSQFGEVSQHLHEAGLLQRMGDSGGWQRLLVEKPFGHDLRSARELNHHLLRLVDEQQIFRIDHYLGKETVQNILMFRFSNSIFEQLWNRQLVDHVQITVSEQQGVGDRGGFYEEAGALRDIGQNHLLQVLALVAMEPPVTLESEAVRNEKVKLLKSIRPITAAQAATQAVRGQYFAGTIEGQPVPGYRQEARVKPDSNVETFMALKLHIDNWRWSGVPFYLRSGKRLPLSASEVRVQFRPAPNVLFAAQCGPQLDVNAITLRLQPHEGISLRFNGKVPGSSLRVRPVRMHFSYNTEFGAYTPEAYERLLLEAMAGDATLFIRSDEVEAAWSLVDPIRQAWAAPLSNREFYAAGTWGPVAAEELMARDGREWRNPQPVA